MEVYRRTLYQPYSIHLTRSSSEVISGIANKVGGTVLGVLLPALTISTSCSPADAGVAAVRSVSNTAVAVNLVTELPRSTAHAPRSISDPGK